MRQLLVCIAHGLFVGCFLPWAVWAGSEHPTIQIQPDGTILDDGTNCVLVGDDGTATINLTPPQRLKDDDWDDKGYNPIRPGSVVYENGFDYTHKGLYLDLASINKAGRTEFHSDYLEVPVTRERTIHSPMNAGKMICLTVKHKPGRTPYSRVQSWFETLGYHGMAIGASWGIDKATGNRLINFGNGDGFSALHGYAFLSVQLKAGQDLKQFYIHQGYTPAQASCLAAGTQMTAYPAMIAMATPMDQLTAAGRYSTFWLSTASKNTIDCIGDTVFQPLGEYISPANGTFRQPGSQSVTDFWAGPGAMAFVYMTQPVYGSLFLRQLDTKPPVMWTKITITSTGGTRTFIRNINQRYFWRDSAMLPFLQDGLTMITVASMEDPSQITTIYLDEYIKQMSSDYSGAALETSERMQEMEEWFQGEINNGLFTIGAMAALQGAVIASPYVKAGVNAMASYLTWAVPYPGQLWNAVATSGFIKAAKSGLAKAGHAIGEKVLAVTGSEYIAGLIPKAPDAIPVVSYGAMKGFALHLSLHYTGPISTLFTAKISDIMTDISDPHSRTRTLFQADLRLVIDHYVAGGGKVNIHGG